MTTQPPNIRAKSQFHLPGQGLPNLQPAPWPNNGFDPRGYQPGYQPGNNTDPWTAFDFLSLPGKPEITLQFAAALNKEQRPEPMVLTLAPSISDLIALTTDLDNSQLDLYYKIEYIFDSGYPSYWDSACNQPDLYPQLATTPTMTPVPAAAVNNDGYKPLSQRGIRFLLRGWAYKIYVAVEGSGGNAINWGGRNVRIDASLAPQGSQGEAQNVDPIELGNPGPYLPTFSRSVRIPTPNGAAAQVFNFVDVGESTIVSYPTQSADVPIPARAVKITTAALIDLFGEALLY